jgi:hypothetical protein
MAEGSIITYRGSPCSSYSISFGLRPSRIGKAAQCFAISSSLSARWRLLRRLFICSRRSFNAFVTASVFVSPVRTARSVANFSVSRFRMFNAIFHHMLQFFYIATIRITSNSFVGEPSRLTPLPTAAEPGKARRLTYTNPTTIRSKFLQSSPTFVFKVHMKRFREGLAFRRTFRFGRGYS